jgi:hypothetical protein
MAGVGLNNAILHHALNCKCDIITVLHGLSLPKPARYGIYATKFKACKFLGLLLLLNHGRNDFRTKKV